MTAPGRAGDEIPRVLEGSTRAWIGAGVWLAVAAWSRPSPLANEWAEALLLLAALVLVPLGFDLTERDDESRVVRRFSRAARLAQLPSALGLMLAYAIPPGPWAAALALPWLGTLALVAGTGALRVRERGMRPFAALCIDAGCLFLAIGGVWCVSDRLGFRPLGFDGATVLLTAIHFHYAGFALPIASGLAAQALPGPGGRLACAGVVAGVPLVAAGITASQLGAGSALESLAAFVLAASGMLVAWRHLRLACAADRGPDVRSLWAVSGIALAVGMALAATYGSRFHSSFMVLDLGWMRAIHGTTNAVGFALAGLAGWRLASGRTRTHGGPRGGE